MSEEPPRTRDAVDIGGVLVQIVVTNRPWLLSIDAIVLSVGGDYGGLGAAFAEEFPEAAWRSVDFRGIVPEKPGLVDLSRTRAKRIQWAILATPHSGTDGVPTLDAIATATAAAVALAARQGATALGIPMLATGDLGLPVEEVAPVAVPAALAAAREYGLSSIVFIAHHNEDGIALATATRETPRFDLQGGVSSDWVSAQVGIPIGRDQLGVAPYVAMFASVIADRTTQTPLSIGIFGKWGSGKSFFMGMLRDQVDRLAGSGNPGFHGDIAQIGFNAWHYADTNLWASLGDEIFRQLAGPEPDASQRRELLRTELAGRIGQRQELEAATRQARVVVAELQADVDDATAGRESRLSDLFDAVRTSPEFTKRLDDIYRKIGVTEDIERARLFGDEFGGTVAEAELLRRTARDRNGRRVLAGSIFGLAACAVLAALAPHIRDVLAGFGVAFLAASGTGITFLARVRSGLGALRSVTEDVRARLDRNAEKRAEPGIRAAADALRRAEADQRVAEAQLADVVTHIGELGRQFAELQPGARLYTFLADRANGDSYRSGLGLISVIRKDFEQLVALLADWRNNRGGDEHHRPIDRIVLYIDDLDRCGPRQVVEVLQAVHLLLALDLFVVVIGVDPRWLLRSVGSHYDSMMTDGAVTPEDYLEKIINIPFSLPGMASGSMRRLLSEIAGNSGIDPAGQPPTATADRDDTIPVETGSEVQVQQRAPQRVELRPLTEGELTLLSTLDALVETPREAKRLFNLYRMLRSTRSLSGASGFLGDGDTPGEYQAVIVLLGLLTAHGALLTQILHSPPVPADGIRGGLMHRPPGTTIADFVLDIRPGNGRNAIVGELFDEAPWTRLHVGLTRVVEQVSLPDVSLVQHWERNVRRFTYA